MAIDIEALKQAASGSEQDKINWYAAQLRNGYTDAQITAAVDKALGSTYATAKDDTKEGGEWNYLQDKAAEQIIKDVGKGTAKEKAIAYNQLYQGAGLTNDQIQQNIKEILGDQKPDEIRALLGMAGARRAAQLATGAEKAEYVKQMIAAGYKPEEIQSYINTAVGEQTPENMAELFRLAGVKLPAAGGAGAGAGNFTTAMRYGDGMTADRTGTGVAVEGDSGLRSGYAPYVQRMLERASAEADVPFQKYTGLSPLLESARMGIANLQTPSQFQQGSNLATAAGIGALNYGQYKPTSFITGTFANPNFNTASGAGIDIAKLKEIGASTDAQAKADFYKNYMTSADQALRGAADQYIGKQSGDDWNALQGLAGFNFANPAPTGKAAGGLLSITKKYSDGGNVALGTDIASSDLSGQNITTGQPVASLAPVNYGGQDVTNVQASYMSPYMKGAIEPALREAKRQSEMLGQVNAAKAVGQGAFGGSRQGLMEAERQRNLMTQLGDIQGKGLQEAYTQGLGQFNVEQNRGLEAQKMGEQSRQFGAELGLKGLQTGIQAGNVLGNLGQQQGAFDLAALKQMADMGKDQQQFDYGEFLRGEKYPYENLTFMRNMLTGLPISSADSYSPGGSSDAFNTFLQALQGMNTLIPSGKAEGGLISGIASLANDD
jgi:hypothetical protein